MQPAIHVEYNDDRISAPIEIPEDIPTPEAIRRSHIGAEANIKAIGQLMLLGVVMGGFNLVRSLAAADASPIGTASILFSLAWLAAAAMCGVWLHALEPKGRLLYTVLSIVQFVMVPFELRDAGALLDGTRATLTAAVVMALVLLLVRLIFLYILWNRKGRMVMSLHYRHEIIPATPGIKYRSRTPFLILLGVVLVIAVVITLAIVSA
jgi:hypothetical protein